MSENDHFTFKRILLADDDEDDIILFREAVDELDHDLTLAVAEDGQELMSKLSEDPKPDIIFLDLNMPRKNGLECLAEIRSNPLLDKTAVVIYSTSSRKKDIDDTRNLGANIYFIKPSSYETLVSKLNEILIMKWEKYATPVSADIFVFSVDRETL